MNNQYANNSYIMQGQPQDLSGLTPVFQNIAGQQAAQNAALAQQNQLVQQAGQVGQSGNMNPMAMAMMLRKGGAPDQAAMNAQDVQMGGLGTYNPMTQYGVAQQYGTDMYSPQSRMIAAQNSGL
jgi:hypothetical protein